MNCYKLPPVLDSKHVLLNHLLAKVKIIVPFSSTIADELALELYENHSHEDILKLLEHETLLKDAILNLKTDGSTKQKLGAELFSRVSHFDTSLCAQVTGMLLDLDVLTICQLLHDSETLEEAVLKAKTEFIKYKQRKECLGEEIYSQVVAQYPDPSVAAQLTGMLLELDVSDLQRLLADSIQFDDRLQLAHSALNRMASEKHKELAAFIKGVHQNLRLQSRCVGAEQAWSDHCQQTHVLEKYAENMKLLATEFWEKNNSRESDLCRINWVVSQCEEYFYKSGYVSAAAKENKLSTRFLNKPVNQVESSGNVLKLIDAGSCYNPFSNFSIFEVTALDLMPATSDVIKCDFLSVNINIDTKVIENPCFDLPAEYFDVVVFSLLLEYLPFSDQRFRCCTNAYKLLKPGGLLFILTPDSKHATANSKVMKSWRHALASLGFWRVSYQKLRHLHCMAFRKCVDPQVSRSWFVAQQCQEQPETLMYIPQDLHDYCDTSADVTLLPERCDVDNSLVADTFSCLPDFDVFS